MDNTSEKFVDEILTIFKLLGIICEEGNYTSLIDYLEKHGFDREKNMF